MSRAPLFPSLDFAGRTVLRPEEIARRLDCTRRHIENVIDEGALGTLNIATKSGGVRCHRVPVESWAEFVATRYSGGVRFEQLLRLPRPALEELHQELGRILGKDSHATARKI